MTSSQHLFIESDANPRLKRWRRLALEAKAVRREGATVLEGIHLLQTVLEHPEVKINAVMLPEGRTTAEAKALAERAAQTSGTRLYVLSDRLYDAISPVENGVGVMCEIALPAAPAPEKWAAADALYLDGVQDAGNVGTLIRTAAAAGVRVVVGGSGDRWFVDAAGAARRDGSALCGGFGRRHLDRKIPGGLSRKTPCGRCQRRRQPL